MRSRSEQITGPVGKRFAIIYSIGDNAQRQGYGTGSRFGLGGPIGENAGQRWDFGDSTPIAFAPEFNLQHADPLVVLAALRAYSERRKNPFPANRNDRLLTRTLVEGIRERRRL